MLVNYYKEQYKIYDKLVKDSNAEDFSLIATLYSIGNGLKVFEGTYKGLLDLFLIARKKDFENQFRNAVNNNPNLKEKYGNIWDEISQSTEAAKVESAKFFTYQMRNQYVIYAQGLLDAAKQLKDGKISRASYDSMVTMIYPVKDNKAVVDEYVKIHLKGIQQYLSKDDLIYKYWLGNKNIQQAFDELISISQITSREKFIKFSQLSYDEILNSDDPFIYFVVNTQDEINKMKKSDKERSQKEQIANQKLGEALYAVYGDAIPPDATGTLRFADGIVKGYDYNGTKAPIKTTFYGALDRYYSFDKKFPFNLPSYWEKLPEEFDPSTPLNFISTNDIVGGNSGSAVVNSNSEIVGLAFDGNIESLPNTYIYTTEANRTVCVSALGMVEAIRDVYKATRLSNELLKGKSE